MEDFITAYKDAINEKNVLVAWRGSALFPKNLHHMLHQLSDDRISKSLFDISTPSHPAT